MFFDSERYNLENGERITQRFDIFGSFFVLFLFDRLRAGAERTNGFLRSAAISSSPPLPLPL
jgi:hypothetical protein